MYPYTQPSLSGYKHCARQLHLIIFPQNQLTLGKTRCVLRLVSALLLLAPSAVAQDYAFTIARIKYGGGGDWYSDEQSLPELLSFVREHTLLDVAPRPDVVELASDKLFTYPYLYLTGHGNVEFESREVRSLRRLPGTRRISAH